MLTGRHPTPNLALIGTQEASGQRTVRCVPGSKTPVEGKTYGRWYNVAMCSRSKEHLNSRFSVVTLPHVEQHE